MPRFVDISGTAPSGAAATVRAAIDAVGKGELVHNVLDYDAVGDGVADDTAEIHAARDAAGVDGKVFFPAGTYLVDGLTASVADQTWELADGATIKMKTGAAKILRVTADGVTVAGGVFDGSNGTAHDGSQTGFQIEGDNVTVRDVTVTDSPFYGIVAYSCNNVTVRGCTVRNSYYGAIFVQNALTAPSAIYDVSITDCLVEGLGDSSAGIGTFGNSVTQRVHRVKICRNTVNLPYDQSDFNSGPIGVIDSTDFVVSDNIVQGGGSMGISCQNSVSGVISGNTVRGFKYAGIELPKTVNSVVVSGNTLDPDGMTPQSGIECSDGTINDLTITGNVIKNFTTAGGYMIRFGSGAVVSRAAITGNVLTSGNADYVGVWFQASVSNTVITGNVIDGTGSTSSAGVAIGYAVNGMSITGNHFSNLTIAAVRFATGSAVTQDKITVSGNSYVSANAVADSNYGAGAAALGSNNRFTEKVAVPASAGASGYTGMWADSSTFHYACVGTNTWVRSTAATW